MTEACPRDRAIIEACPQRLRPILMTAGIAVIVLLPIAIAPRTGLDAYQPLATAVVGGLIVGTILSLFDLPIMHTYVDDLTQWLHKTFLGREWEWPIMERDEDAEVLVNDAERGYDGPHFPDGDSKGNSNGVGCARKSGDAMKQQPRRRWLRIGPGLLLALTAIAWGWPYLFPPDAKPKIERTLQNDSPATVASAPDPTWLLSQRANLKLSNAQFQKLSQLRTTLDARHARIAKLD